MPPVPLTRETYPDFKQRLEKLTPDAQRRFGSMDALKMMRHMRNVHETALEEISYEDKTVPVLSKVLFFTFTRLMKTWPGGKIKAPDFWTPPAAQEFDDERRDLEASIERFLDALDDNPNKIVQNPFFGKLPLKEWSRLNGIHFHHHLRQFGV